MTFVETVKSIINSEWFQAATSILYPVVSFIFIILVNVLKNKLAKVTNSTDANISQIFTGIKNVVSDSTITNKKIEDLKSQNEEMRTTIQNTTAISTALLEILSSVYMQSKAVDKDTKELIGKVMCNAKELGLKVDDAINKMAEQNKKTIEAGAEIVEKIQEKINEDVETSSTQAKDTEQEALSLYNDLIKQVGSDE